MKRKELLKLIVGVTLIAVLAASMPLLGGCAAPAPPEVVEPVVIGFVGSFASDTGRSTLRCAQMAVDELNEAGGILGGRPIKYVTADSAEDVIEGIKSYEYLNEVEHCDFIVSGCIDDVSTGWFPRMAEYKTPTLDTWTSSYLLIQKVVEDYETYKMYFMNVCNDWLLGIPYCDFGKDILNAKCGFDTYVLFQEDTAYAAGVAEFVVAEVAPYAGIEILDHVVYDIETVDFAPIYADIVATDPDFIYHISSVNCVVPTAQYVELQVPLPITGINVAAFGWEYWEDTGGMGGGVSTLVPPPSIGMALDPKTEAFIAKYQLIYTERPIFPHFNGPNAYYGIYEAVEAAERVYAAGLGSGFEPLDAWVEEMEKTDLVLWLYGGEERDDDLSPTGEDVVWYVERYYKPGDIEPITGMEWTHNAMFDATGDEGKVSVQVNQWYEDGTVRCIYPPKYATGEIAFPSWVPDEKIPDWMGR